MKTALFIFTVITGLILSASASPFAFQLYGQLSKTEGNLFFSPASIEAALQMAQEGAAGSTRNQFNALLPANALTKSFPMVGTNVTLESANAMWVNQNFPILGNFRSAVVEKHGAEIRPEDFTGQPDSERLKINKWVEEKTRNKIQDLLPEGSVTPMTRLLLVNAIYFKGNWLHAFDPEKTVTSPFQTLENEMVEVPMMQLAEKRFNYGENDCFQTLELPYEGNEVSMLLILPKRAEALSHVEECFAADNLEKCTAEMRRREVNVFLPRFKVESTFASLKKHLASLGLTDAFSDQLADFSGISEQPLYISDVAHKAFVEVNEEGTEAAAATGIIMRTTALGPPPAVFRADHPFLFLIRKNDTGKILFMGRICDPSK
jgi:serpin B